METVANTNVVSIGFWIKTGSRDESPEQAGFSHFLEHMLFKGTKKRNALDIAKEIDRLGGSINAYTEHEVCCFYCSLPYFHLDNAIEVLSDIITQSVLDADEIEKEKSVVIHEIISAYDSPEETGIDLYLSDFWGDHPLGNKITAEVDQIKKISRNKLLEFYYERYLPHNLTVSVAGRFEVNYLVKLLQDNLIFKNESCFEINRVIPKRIEKWRFIKDRFKQVHIYSGMQIKDMKTIKSYYSLLVFSTLFGESMSSRLFQHIREKYGFCYSIYSFRSNFSDTSLLTLYACTTPDFFIPLIKAIENEWSLLLKEFIDVKEIEDAKSHLKGSMLLFMEDMEGRMKRLFRVYHNTGSLLEVDSALLLLDEVNLNDLKILVHDNVKADNFNLLAYGCPRIKRFEQSKFLF